MTPLRHRPWYCLTRHFFGGLFDLGFLSDAGADSFTRMVIGCCALFLSFGLLLVRLFAIKYAQLSALRSAELFRQAQLADHAFLIALPMWIVAFVTVLIGHSLFPDETDFRVLMVLPVSRAMVFGAKLLALILFAGLFIAASHLALTPLHVLMSVARWAEHPWPVQLAASGAASLLAAAFAVVAVAAVHGLLVIAAPRGRLLATSAALRSVMIGLLVISLPLVLRLPGQGRSFAAGAWWLSVVPPAWFVGIERWLLGDESRAHLVRLAQLGAIAFAVALGIAAGSYAILYHRFERVMSRPAHGGTGSTRRIAFTRWNRVVQTRPVFAAIRTFTVVTLRRSVLHQGILVALSAIGVGVVVNSLIAADLFGWLSTGGAARVRLVAAVVWAPFPLMFVVSLAVRMALAVPIEQRANWVFRMTEQETARIDQLAAATYTVLRIGAILPVVATAPLAWLVLGPLAIGPAIVTVLCGWLLVEILMKEWARIPFTCSYIPGKGFVPQTMLTGLASFVLFTSIGAALAQFSLRGTTTALAINAVLLAMALTLRQRRLNAARTTPLVFEDQLPTEVNPLRLSTD